MKIILNNTILFSVLRQIKLCYNKRKWHSQNKNNQTVLNNNFNFKLVSVGNYSYGELNVVSFADTTKLKIGSFVSIAQNVTFLLDVEHYYNHISTYPFKVKILESRKNESFGKGDIIVDDDVWIGYGAIILSGVHIGQGAVIGAGAIVTKDVPPYAVVGGNPAKIIKYRFEQDMIDELLKIDYGKLTKDKIEKHIDELYVELKDKEQLEWTVNQT